MWHHIGSQIEISTGRAACDGQSTVRGDFSNIWISIFIKSEVWVAGYITRGDCSAPVRGADPLRQQDVDRGGTVRPELDLPPLRGIPKDLGFGPLSPDLSIRVGRSLTDCTCRPRGRRRNQRPVKRNPRSLIRGLRRSRLGTTGQLRSKRERLLQPAPEVSISRIIG
jgi:hypothetical protein